MHRFAFTARRLGASLAAGGAAAALVASEQNRQPRCSAVEVRQLFAEMFPDTSVSELETRLEQAAELEKRQRDGAVVGAGKRTKPSREISDEVSGTRTQREFFSKEMSIMGVPLRAHSAVSDSALYVAADRVSRMLREQPAAVLQRLMQCGASIHLIGEMQNTSDLPEHRHMKGVDGGYTGEKGVTLDMRARGMGGLQTSCGEENLLDLDSDPRYAGRDILTHEFAHCLMDYGLSPALRAEIRATHKRVVEQTDRWRRPDGSLAYAGSNASEYWAELSMWYFGSHGEYVDRAARVPPPGPHALAEYDPDGFRLLGQIYGGTHPLLKSDELVAPKRLAPTAADATSGGAEEADGEAALTTLHFVNRRGRGDADVLWIDQEGAPHKYGCVGEGGTLSQQTFATHVWEVRPTGPEGKPARYRAKVEEGTVAVDEDCFGARPQVGAVAGG